MGKKFLSLFVLPLALLACGSDEKPKANGSGSGSGGGSNAAAVAQKPAVAGADEIVGLIPKDAALVVQFKSAAWISTKGADLMQVFDTPMGDPLQFLGVLAVPTDSIDPKKPVVLAVRADVATAGMQAVTAIVGMKDGTDAMQLGAKASAGGFGAFSQAMSYEGGAGAFAHGMPGSDIVVRVDLAKFIQTYRTDIDGAVMSMQGFAGMMTGGMGEAATDAQRAVGEFFEGVTEFINASERLEIVLDYDDGLADLAIAWSVNEDSALAKSGTSRLGELAERVPADVPLAMLWAMDMKGYLENFKTLSGMFMQQMPEEKRKQFQELMDASSEGWGGLGDEWMMGIRLRADGGTFVAAGRADDPGAYVGTYLEMAKKPVFADAGILLTPEAAREVEGATVQRVRWNLDLDKFAAFIEQPMSPEAKKALRTILGEKGIPYDMAALGDTLAFTVSEEDGAIDQVLAGVGHKGLRDAAGRLPGSLGFVLHIDLRSFLAGTFAWARALAPKIGEDTDDIPVCPAGGPVEGWIGGSQDGRHFRLGVQANLKTWKAFFQEMDEAN